MAPADPGAEIEDVRGWDPRLRQPADQQQLAQMPGVSPVGLRALLRPPQPARLRRLGEMHAGADALGLLDHEPPARRCLQRDLELLPREAPQEAPARGWVRRPAPAARDLAGRKVDPLRGDLRPVLIEPHHDRQPLRRFTRIEPSPDCDASSVQPDPSHTVGHGRYLLLDWPAARPYPRAPDLCHSTRRAGHLRCGPTPTLDMPSFAIACLRQ